MSPNRKKHNAKYRRPVLSPEEREWRAFRGESPNPWGKTTSAGTSVMEIVTERRPSKLEQRSDNQNWP